jgi:hypothetical protein
VLVGAVIISDDKCGLGAPCRQPYLLGPGAKNRRDVLVRRGVEAVAKVVTEDDCPRYRRS